MSDIRQPDAAPRSPRLPPAAAATPPNGAGAPPAQPASAGAGAASPTAAPGTPGTANPSTVPALAPLDLPPVFIDRVPQQRGSLSSMIMMTLLFFFMSSGNPPNHGIEIGDDGKIRQRETELDRIRGVVGEYRGWMNGTGNWSEPDAPQLLPTTLVPPPYDHAQSSGPFFQNITGWYRKAKVTYADLIAPAGEPIEPAPGGFFSGVQLPALNTSSWNATRAAELRGEFDWAHVVDWDMQVRERWVAASMVGDDGKGKGKDHPGGATSSRHTKTMGFVDADTPPPGFVHLNLASPPRLSPKAWAWVKASVTVTARSPPMSGEESEDAEKTLDYEFFGLHYLANGTYELYGMPDGMHVDIRHIPRLFPGQHNETAAIVLAELEKELKVQEDSLMLTDVRPDEIGQSACPLLLHLALPPLPVGVKLSDVEAYDAELANPTGILASLARPPHYWSSLEGLGGVAVADQCGFVLGFDKGRGVRLDDFWRKSVNYAAYATLSQLIVLVLLVRQMEATRTPSTLAKVSLWTIVLIGVSDAWIFSAHLAVGVMSNNKTSLPTIVPGFLALCTAIVFAPRYAVLLHRIQAPERAITARPTPASPTDGSAGEGAQGGDGEVTAGPPSEPREPFLDQVANTLAANPILKWVGGAFIVLVLFNVVLTPQLIPFIFFGMHSVWVPQIWRNARRGSSRGLNTSFIVGLSIARLALPLYGLGCPDNIFFTDRADWIWPLVAWVAVQVAVLLAQDRFGPAFFLPKRFAPQEGYNYHPLLPSPTDPESGIGLEEAASTTCSICMEEVDTRAARAPGGPEGETSGAHALLAMNARRAYAVAPCHHLFHTKCLQQWMAIKTICPLCKRPLPPL